MGEVKTRTNTFLIFKFSTFCSTIWIDFLVVFIFSCFRSTYRQFSIVFKWVMTRGFDQTMGVSFPYISLSQYISPMLNRAQIWDWSIGTGPQFRTWPVLKQTFSPSYNAAAAKIFIDNFGQKRWPQFSPLASLLMPAPRLKRTREQWNESFDRNRTIRQQSDELADEKNLHPMLISRHSSHRRRDYVCSVHFWALWSWNGQKREISYFVNYTR